MSDNETKTTYEHVNGDMVLFEVPEARRFSEKSPILTGHRYEKRGKSMFEIPVVGFGFTFERQGDQRRGIRICNDRNREAKKSNG